MVRRMLDNLSKRCEHSSQIASFEIVPKEAVSPRPCRYRDIRLRMPGLSTTLTTIHASPKARGFRLGPSSCRRLCALALRRRAPAVCPRPPYKCAHACLMRAAALARCIDISRNHDKKMRLTQQTRVSVHKIQAVTTKQKRQ